jgi:hypothetical protein
MEAPWPQTPVPLARAGDDLHPAGAAALRTNGTPYLIHLGRGENGKPNAVQLTKPDDTAYAVDLENVACGCPDHQYGGRPCKHYRGCRTALKALGRL